ncbi:hypothetical protein ACGFY6_32740 [Streptomyces sp. NPDC048387]|uniref:hypothetical protein n=1 Tax=Streptomyces sp. NPDC048387 TaxID=3365542 RepID=UPI0037204113
MPAFRVRPVIHHDLGAKVRTTAVLAAVLAQAEAVTFPIPGGDAFCPGMTDGHLVAMEAADAPVTVDEYGRTIHPPSPPAASYARSAWTSPPPTPPPSAPPSPLLLLAARIPGESS